MWLARSMDLGELTPVEETALLTEYARALDSRSPRPILGDTLADEVVGKMLAPASVSASASMFPPATKAVIASIFSDKSDATLAAILLCNQPG